MSNLADRKIQLSVVIAAWNENALLRTCLASLEGQTDKSDLEVIVAANYPVDFPVNEFSVPLKILNLSETAIVPQLRAAGIEAAGGEIVALVEDHCFFDARWTEQIKKAHESADIVGGSVENADRQSALDWAVYFYDYGKYALPNRAGAAETLSGMNVTYKRSVLDEIRGIYEPGFYETFVNEELKRRGYELFLEPAAIVFHNKNYQMKRAAAHCYHLARAFAAQRAAGAGVSKRAFLTAASFALPILLPARIFASTIQKGRRAKQLIMAAPFVVFLTFIWSYGEFCGYLLGAGRSAGEWK